MGQSVSSFQSDNTNINMVVGQECSQIKKPDALDITADEDKCKVSIQKDESNSGKEEKHESLDLSRLQELIPSITGKDNITSLDIILEAIRYIDTLQDTLAHKISTGERGFGKDDREETG